MEVYGILGLLENIFKLSKTPDDKRLALQQKFVYVLYKKESITFQDTKIKLYNQALQYLNEANYHSIRQVLEEYVNYHENNVIFNNQIHDIIDIQSDGN